MFQSLYLSWWEYLKGSTISFIYNNIKAKCFAFCWHFLIMLCDSINLNPRLHFKHRKMCIFVQWIKHYFSTIFAIITKSHQFISLEKNTLICQATLLYLFLSLYIHIHFLFLPLVPFLFCQRSIEIRKQHYWRHVPLMKRLANNSINRD